MSRHIRVSTLKIALFAVSAPGRAEMSTFAESYAPQATLASRLKACVSLVARVIDRQRQRRALLDLDDHLLNDIGVSRQAAIKEGRKPFWKS